MILPIKKGVLKRFEILNELVKENRFQPGYPNWHGQYELKLEMKPGAQPGVTHCNEFVDAGAKALGININAFLNINPHNGEPDIGWTGANDMYKNARASMLKPGIRLNMIPEHAAQMSANSGGFCLVLAHNLTINKKTKLHNSGHISIVYPFKGEFDYRRGCRIIQAGSKMGQFFRSEIFYYKELSWPVFIEVLA